MQGIFFKIAVQEITFVLENSFYHLSRQLSMNTEETYQKAQHGNAFPRA